MNDELIQKINRKVRENHRFTIPALSDEFSQVSSTIFHEAITEMLGYRKLNGYAQARFSIAALILNSSCCVNMATLL